LNLFELPGYRGLPCCKAPQLARDQRHYPAASQSVILFDALTMCQAARTGASANAYAVAAMKTSILQKMSR